MVCNLPSDVALLPGAGGKEEHPTTWRPQRLGQRLVQARWASQAKVACKSAPGRRGMEPSSSPGARVKVQERSLRTTTVASTHRRAEATARGRRPPSGLGKRHGPGTRLGAGPKQTGSPKPSKELVEVKREALFRSPAVQTSATARRGTNASLKGSGSGVEVVLHPSSSRRALSCAHYMLLVHHCAELVEPKQQKYCRAPHSYNC